MAMRMTILSTRWTKNSNMLGVSSSRVMEMKEQKKSEIVSEWKCRECTRCCTVKANAYGAPACPYPKLCDGATPMWDSTKYLESQVRE